MDQQTDALRRELQRARAEGRWGDADAVAQAIEARQGVVRLDEARAARPARTGRR